MSDPMSTPVTRWLRDYVAMMEANLGVLQSSRIEGLYESIVERILEVREYLKGAASDAPRIALRLQPDAWMRGVTQPGGPWGPTEYDVEVVSDCDGPPNDGNKWTALYRAVEEPAATPAPNLETIANIIQSAAKHIEEVIPRPGPYHPDFAALLALAESFKQSPAPI